MSWCSATVQVRASRAWRIVCTGATQPLPRDLTYRLDERLLFCLVTGLVSWNAMEASALIGVSREPDVYVHDLHRSMVHFTLLS